MVIFQRIFGTGICIPIPFLNRWLPGLRLRLLDLDLDPSDASMGFSIRFKWGNGV